MSHPMEMVKLGYFPYMSGTILVADGSITVHIREGKKK